MHVQLSPDKKTNEDILGLIGQPPIENELRKLHWFGHEQRMGSERTQESF